MFNGDLKKNALKELDSTHREYTGLGGNMYEKSQELFLLRKKSSEVVIDSVEKYINTLTNTPKKFERAFLEYRAEFKTFNELIFKIQREAIVIEVNAAGSAAVGVATGAGVAAFAPTAAMAIATTFGAASTGTAISALSGAAATNAALAWIGGGALVAGGGGMAAGNAMLALAGPVGWAIGGTALVGGALMARSKNKKIAEEANSKRREIEKEIRKLEIAIREINRLLTLTVEHADGMTNLLKKLKSSTPSNYLSFSENDKDLLAAMINHVHSLSALLNKKVE